MQDICQACGEFRGASKRCVENDTGIINLQAELAGVRERLARATAEAATARQVLGVCRHELTTHHGFYATDNLDLYNNLISEGYEPHKAWDKFSDTLVEFDCKRSVSQIDGALASTPLAAAML